MTGAAGLRTADGFLAAADGLFGRPALIGLAARTGLSVDAAVLFADGFLAGFAVGFVVSGSLDRGLVDKTSHL